MVVSNLSILGERDKQKIDKLNLAVVGHLVFELFFEVVVVEALFADFGEFELEVLAGGDTRVLEPSQPLVGNAVEVTAVHGLTQGALASVGFEVFGTGEPAEEVGGTVVLEIAGQMMAKAFVFLSGFRVNKYRTRSIMRKRHGAVARDTAVTQIRRGMVATMEHVRRGQIVCHSLSVRIEEIAVGMSPSDDAVAFFGRDLAAALGEEVEPRGHVV